MSKKTPMQELIWTLKEMQQSLYPCGLHEAIEMAECMLEKEKEVMCQFQSDGQRTDFFARYEDNDDCFEQTFNTKEK